MDFKIWVASFNNLGLTASGPEALDMSKNLSISSTSFPVITICSRLPCCLRNILGVRIGNVPTSLPFSKKIPQVTIKITDLYL
jgi:hypothetical protein